MDEGPNIASPGTNGQNCVVQVSRGDEASMQKPRPELQWKPKAWAYLHQGAIHISCHVRQLGSYIWQPRPSTSSLGTSPHILQHTGFEEEHTCKSKGGSPSKGQGRSLSSSRHIHTSWTAQNLRWSSHFRLQMGECLLLHHRQFHKSCEAQELRWWSPECQGQSISLTEVKILWIFQYFLCLHSSCNHPNESSCSFQASRPIRPSHNDGCVF